MNLRITLLAFLCLCATAILRAERVDMLKAGAKANGKALNTKLINSTIDRLNRGGGGEARPELRKSRSLRQQRCSLRSSRFGPHRWQPLGR